MKISVHVDINKEKKYVWAAISDIENSLQMISAIIDLKVIEPATTPGENPLIGLKWQETRKMLGKEATETMWITDCVEQQYYCTRAENCGAVYITKLLVEDLNEHAQAQTRLTMSFSGEADTFIGKLMSKIMALLMKKSMIKMLNKDLQDIKQFVEPA